MGGRLTISATELSDAVEYIPLYGFVSYEGYILYLQTEHHLNRIDAYRLIETLVRTSILAFDQNYYLVRVDKTRRS